MDRPTFSQSWSRVNRLTPMLRPQVQIRRRSFRGVPWYIAQDPMGNQFFRLNPIAYHLVGLLDGKRTVDEAWKMTLERYGDDAPTQHEVIGLLGQLNQANLLRIDLPPDAEPLLARQRRRNARIVAMGAMSLMFLQLPLFNPDRLLRKLLPFFRPLLSRLGLVLWALWLLVALWIFLPQFPVFVRDTGSILAPANWGWMILIFILTKLWHELGHGLLCRRLGGPVHECGVMILVLFPSPYMDTTSSWGFDSKWKRMLVGAGGMMFELALAGLAAIVWTCSTPDTLTRQLAHNVVLLASAATILFNANPLMRFDGYFILSDWLETPNLYERSNRHLFYLAQRYFLNLKNAQPVSSLPSERTLLFIYGIGAALYRVLVMFGIILYIAGWAFTLGLFMAAWSLTTWLVVPTARFSHWLVTSPQLHRKRARALGLTGAALAGLIVAFGVIPMPDHRRTEGVVEADQRQDLVIQADGFVKAVYVESGQAVEKDQILLQAENPALSSRRRELLGHMEELRIAQRQALGTKPTDRESADARLEFTSRELAEVERQLADLTLRSPIAGRLIAPPLQGLPGSFLKRGQTLGQVIDPNSLRVTALVDQSQNSLASFDHARAIELRTTGRLDAVLPSRLLRVFDAGWTRLPHPALGHQGGGQITTDPQDSQGMTAQRPQFTLWLSLPPASLNDISPASSPAAPAGMTVLPGERIHVRFTLEHNRPLLFQWLQQLQQLFRERINI